MERIFTATFKLNSFNFAYIRSFSLTDLILYNLFFFPKYSAVLILCILIQLKASTHQLDLHTDATTVLALSNFFLLLIPLSKLDHVEELYQHTRQKQAGWLERSYQLFFISVVLSEKAFEISVLDFII